MKRIGFIGLGIMGKPMCMNLLKAGYSLTVNSRNQASVAVIVQAGAIAAASPQEVAAQSDMVITMLPNSPQVQSVILGENGVLAGARPGTVVVDMSSIAPLVSREVAAQLARSQVRFLDAPVSGGEPKAVEGTLSIMVGGSQGDFDVCLPILQAMGASVVRVGDVGAGNVAKLANQIIVALNIAAMSEALVLATKAGVAPEVVYQAIRGGLAGSAVLDAKAPMVLNRNFTPGFKTDLHIKDLDNVLETAHAIGVPLPLTAAVMEMMQALKVQGMGGDDHGGLIRYYEMMAQVAVKKEQVG